MTISDALEKDFAKNIMDNLISGTKELMNTLDRRNNEVTYFIKRLENLIALINLSESDIPKELIRTWVEETLSELVNIEGVSSGG